MVESQGLEEKKGSVAPVTINNNYNSNVIAVISKDIDKSKAPEGTAAINIFMGDEKKGGSNLPQRELSEVMTRSNKLNALTTGLGEGDKERVMDRLLQSVNMVKEVLQSNLKLREQVQDLGQRLDQQNADLFHLQCENEEQRDKINILAGMKPDPTIPVQSMSNTEDVSPVQGEDSTKKSGTPNSRMDVAEEILQLKRDKSMLEQRVQYLELENINMHTNTSHGKRPSMPGTDDFEPVRSVVNGKELRPLAPPARQLGCVNGRRVRKRSKIRTQAGPPRTSYEKVRNTCKSTSISSRSNT